MQKSGFVFILEPSLRIKYKRILPDCGIKVDEVGSG